ncbi:MAG: protein adenylyltransferase SelO [Acidimicrobiales bacterium]
MTTVDIELPWDNSFTSELPADPDEGPGLRQVTGAAFSRVTPTAVAAPKLIVWSPEVSADLGLTAEHMNSTEMVEALAGNRVLPGTDTFAMNYGGHQFGNWAGQLGDGRAITLGQLRAPDGSRQMLQLKGAGPTPYSRRADGRAVLRSSVREFLCSEAMHFLGVPTTRALSLVLTGDDVVRDMFYDGNAAPEPGAIVCRVAPSFIRFGTFELPASRGEDHLLKSLADYTIRHHFADLPGASDPVSETYLAWFEEVCQTTAKMIIDWMRVGFVHGVMNTDNLSIHGITIDYGPYGWLEDFDPGWTPNTTDAHMKRYQYGNQPGIAQWNLVRFANAIYPLIGDVIPLQEALDRYSTTFLQGNREAMAAKLGFTDVTPADDELFDALDSTLQMAETDMPIFYRNLARVDMGELNEAEIPEPLMAAYYQPDQLTPDVVGQIHRWLTRYAQRVEYAPDTKLMNSVNPKYVLRNYIAQLAIDAATAGDYSVLHEVYDVLRRPYDEQPEMERWAERRPEWARTRPGCSMLSCSS